MSINVNRVCMKKMILLAVIASVTLASCVKNEVTPDEENGSNAISYQTVVGTMSRGLSSTQTKFPITSTFGSFAYFVAGNGTWAANANDPTTTLYINDEEIKYHASASALFNVNTWHATAVHYWPKQGSLTFFAYTPKTISVTCEKTTGIKAGNYNVDANKNVDFMVADMVADKNQNTTIYEYNGVPTLFRHKLTQIGFKIKTASDYANGHSSGSYAAGDKVIELTGIKINNVANQGIYTQLPAEGWSGQTGTVDYTHFSGNQAVTTTLAEAKNADAQTIVLPQTFSDNVDVNITITYTIKTYTDGTNYSTEIVTETKKLYELHSGTSNAWEMNKNITYGITIDLSSQIIYWDPAIENWDNVDNGIDI